MISVPTVDVLVDAKILRLDDDDGVHLARLDPGMGHLGGTGLKIVVVLTFRVCNRNIFLTC